MQKLQMSRVIPSRTPSFLKIYRHKIASKSQQYFLGKYLHNSFVSEGKVTMSTISAANGEPVLKLQSQRKRGAREGGGTHPKRVARSPTFWGKAPAQNLQASNQNKTRKKRTLGLRQRVLCAAGFGKQKTRAFSVKRHLCQNPDERSKVRSQEPSATKNQGGKNIGKEHGESPKHNPVKKRTAFPPSGRQGICGVEVGGTEDCPQPDLCVSSLHRGQATLLCIVPILSDDP